MTDSLIEAIDITRNAIEENSARNWVIGFSGGKNSTALLKIFVSSLQKARRRPNNVKLIYCDTGVENPLIDGYVKRLLSKLDTEFQRNGLPISTQILKSPVKERFFVKVIGRGYPTPTNSFRWCTKNLRIKPVEKFINALNNENTVVALGIRRSESEQRKRSIKKHGDGVWQVQSESRIKYSVFAPLLEMGVSNIWDAVFFLDKPNAVDPHELQTIYRDASGECPVIRSPDAPPCASGRFGCWTCTVVRKDRSAQELISRGYSDLEPYLALRNWLSEFRDRSDMRWPVKRNGRVSPGPFRIAARKIILSRVRDLEMAVGTEIVNSAETEEIFRLWELDFERETELGLVPI